MLSLVGIYENGFVKFDTEYSSANPVKVIVTFVEELNNENEKTISLNDFSFDKSKKNLQSFKGSFSETVISERRKDL